MLNETRDSLVGDYEEYCLVECDTM